MKLLIDVPLVFMAYDDPGTTDQDRADSKFTYDDGSDVLTKFGVHHVLTYNANSVVLTIEPQKISLDDLAMNELMFDGLWLFDLDFRYAGLGGSGCEISFTVISRP